MSAPIETLQLAQQAIASVMAENEKLRRALVELDCGGGNYLTSRVAIAKLSGIAAMAATFDEHLKKIQAKIDRASYYAQFNGQECWIYQGDGEDHLESLTCPVLIQPVELAALLSQSKGDL